MAINPPPHVIRSGRDLVVASTGLWRPWPFCLADFQQIVRAPDRSTERLYKAARVSIDLMMTSPLGTNPIVEELVHKVGFYGVAEIPAELLACLEDIATDLAEDDGTGWRLAG